MPKVNLTDRYIKAARPAPAGTRLIHWDAAQPALGLRVTDRGRKSFVIVRRVAGSNKLHYFTLGAYPELLLADARRRTPEVLRTLADGKTPKQAKADALAERKRTEEERRANAFAVVAEEYIRRRVPQRKSAKDRKEVENRIRRELVGRWRDRRITEITRRDVIRMVEEIIDCGGPSEPGRRRKKGGPFAARHALADARNLFDWAINRDVYGLEHSPCDRIKASELHGAAKRRRRILEDWELRAVWDAAGGTDYPYGPLVRLLMLTGQRRSEVAKARWPEINLDEGNEGRALVRECRNMLGTTGAAGLLTIPPDRMKEEAGHTVPLTPRAVALLRGLPRFAAGDYVFSTTGGERPFSGFSKAKARIDALAGKLAGRPVAGWTHHDIRRTLRTALSAERVPQEVAEMVIAHKREGVEAVYDLHRFDDEKREALLLWEKRLLSIVEPR